MASSSSPIDPPINSNLVEPIQIPASARRTSFIQILYGSQTGNSCSLAYRLYNHLTRIRFNVKVNSLENYDGQFLSQQADSQSESNSNSDDSSPSLSLGLPPIFIFLISTTGVGHFPTTSVNFWNSLLRSDLPNHTFDHLQFLTFALGDSSYERFCWPARKLNRRLKALGAMEFGGIQEVEADDKHYLGIDGTYLPWLSNLTEKLDSLDPLPSNESLIPDDALLPPQVDIDFLSEQVLTSTSSNGNEFSISLSQEVTAGSSKAPIPQTGGWKEAKLTRNERMTSQDHYQDVRLIEWERPDGQEISHRPGDIAIIIPSNSKVLVDRTIAALGWETHADRLVQIRKKRRKVDEQDEEDTDFLPSHAPSNPTTLRSLLTHHLSPLSIPDLSFFLTLLQFSPPHLTFETLPNPTPQGYDPKDGESLERSKLKEFTTPGEGQDECFEYAGRVKRTKLEVLEEFGATAKRIPVRFAVELLGWMSGREFSIASGAKLYPNKVQLSIALVKYKTRLKEPRKGICSRWLENLQEGSTFPFRITSGTLSSKRPPSSNLPLVLVGPGTGVAPMRAFIHDRLSDFKKGENLEIFNKFRKEKIPNTLLFCGCRFRDKDFLFGDEWKSLAGSSSDQNPSNLHDKVQKDPETVFSYQLASSRDTEEKVYVQDLMKEEAQSQLLWKVVGKMGGSVFVSGSSGPMPKAVKKALESSCIKYGEMDQDQAKRFLLKLEKEGRWREECWT